MNYYTEALRKYATFSGRSRRAEYWYFFLFNFIIAFFIGVIDGYLGISSLDYDGSVLADLYSLFVFLPSIAVGVRRMHDINKSGWFLLIPLYNLILLAERGTDGENKYGSDPLKKISAEDASLSEKNESASIKYCSGCGSQIDADSKFCANCGSKIK